MSKTLKYYSNRNLYDTNESRYTNHLEVIEHLKKGLDIEIIDHNTGHNIEDVILCEVIKSVKLTKEQLVELIVNADVRD